jgi:hypothetical protein
MNGKRDWYYFKNNYPFSFPKKRKERLKSGYPFNKNLYPSVDFLLISTVTSIGSPS